MAISLDGNVRLLQSLDHYVYFKGQNPQSCAGRRPLTKRGAARRVTASIGFPAGAH
jgi:hypothetical protein